MLAQRVTDDVGVLKSDELTFGPSRVTGLSEPMKPPRGLGDMYQVRFIKIGKT